MAACRALAGRESLQTIAINLGYADQPHLTRDFSQRIGIAPAAYRKMNT
jgi:AraC-like DNA-binding protein